MIKKLKRVIKNPASLVQYCSRRGWLRWMKDETYLKLIYKLRLGKKLNLDHPQTFNEKMQWLKLYDRKPEYCCYVDKYKVREYIRSTIGSEYLIPLLGVWDKAEDIDFDQLPNQFVLKCNHDSSSVIICKDKKKLDVDAARRKLNYCLKNNGYNFGREWPYKNLVPCIIAEKYMEDCEGKGDLTDYKIHCYNGEPKAVQVISDRYSPDGIKNDYYTLDWQNYGLTRGAMHNAGYVAPKPEQLPQMLDLARKLSEGIPFLRVDFYIINDRIYFGELTFFPASGFNPFTPEKWDGIFGEWIELPIK